MAIQYSEIEYRSFGKCVCLDNGLIRLIATLDFGPRIISFSLSGSGNVLFEDENRDFCELNKGYGTWYAYGGHRLWTAPELLPETYYPDNKTVISDYKDGILTLRTERTPFGKEFSLSVKMTDAASVEIRNSILNVSEQPALFAPWSITSLAPGGTEFIPFSKKQTGFLPNRTTALWSYSDLNDARYRAEDAFAVLRQDPEAAKPFKVGFNVCDGYAVYALGNQIFRKKFAPYSEVRYPDFGCNFETYTNKNFLECEILGEMREYAPGEAAVIEETWELCETKQSHEELIADLIKAHIES